MNIRRCTVDEVERSGVIAQLLDKYAEESSSPEFGQVQANFAMYRAMEAGGAMHVLGAFAPELVGFAVLIVYGLPHYGGRCVCAMESLFVAPAARKTGAGRKLLRAAETLAAEKGAAGLLVSAPTGGRLAKVLSRSGYRHSSQVFVRALA